MGNSGSRVWSGGRSQNDHNSPLQREQNLQVETHPESRLREKKKKEEAFRFCFSSSSIQQLSSRRRQTWRRTRRRTRRCLPWVRKSTSTRHLLIGEEAHWSNRQWNVERWTGERTPPRFLRELVPRRSNSFQLVSPSSDYLERSSVLWKAFFHRLLLLLLALLVLLVVPFLFFFRKRRCRSGRVMTHDSWGRS